MTELEKTQAEQISQLTERLNKSIEIFKSQKDTINELNEQISELESSRDELLSEIEQLKSVIIKYKEVQEKSNTNIKQESVSQEYNKDIFKPVKATFSI